MAESKMGHNFAIQGPTEKKNKKKTTKNKNKNKKKKHLFAYFLFLIKLNETILLLLSGSTSMLSERTVKHSAPPFVMT